MTSVLLLVIYTLLIVFLTLLTLPYSRKLFRQWRAAAENREVFDIVSEVDTHLNRRSELFLRNSRPQLYIVEGEKDSDNGA